MLVFDESQALPKKKLMDSFVMCEIGCTKPMLEKLLFKNKFS